MATHEEILKKRDVKVKPHLAQYAPIWIVDEKFVDEDESVQFNVVFQHHLYGWVNRRYRYDSFNNVLYHKGQTTLDEDDTLDIQEQTPYIEAMITDIPNSYGG